MIRCTEVVWDAQTISMTRVEVQTHVGLEHMLDKGRGANTNNYIGSVTSLVAIPLFPRYRLGFIKSYCIAYFDLRLLVLGWELARSFQFFCCDWKRVIGANEPSRTDHSLAQNTLDCLSLARLESMKLELNLSSARLKQLSEPNYWP